MHELIKNLFMILKVKHVGNIHKRFKQVLKIWILIINAFLYFYYTFLRLCIKVGRGQGDGDVGTRVWGLGT